MAEHTPGPWTVEYDDDGVEIRAAGDLMGTIIHGKEMDANALLIEACPDLLVVAKLAQSLLSEEYGDSYEVLKRLDAAIAKAEGRE